MLLGAAKRNNMMHRSGMSTPGHGVPSMTHLPSDMTTRGSSTDLTGKTDPHHSLPNIDFQNLNISFNGCGFLGIYHVGVATALRTYVPHFRIENVCGASAGALAAVCLLANVPAGRNNLYIQIRKIVKVC